ncbi:branched-chain amino acid ABC transporter permease [Caproiciproducens sp. CPB-2]|uniref:branched-chain amino acid ABC transporter permease n=1 Tax=Caproiciproducens sp. CPB-2 TaxID=3030017 RepID=UPI0023DCDF31|nr:branched-chain amino acid ABC transporter permease [Caproiciproducens sp. CPB-2]MDF1494679.1 branched-chain amino acid ABC transporter permease [Caproiciproducens sp. CPB-2]
MESFLQLVVSGISMGCIYCLVAIEFSLIWNASGLINFGHDSFIMFGAYIFAGSMILRGNLSVPAAIISSLIFMAAFGVLVAVTIFIPLSRLGSDIFAVMGTIMLAKIISEGVRLFYGASPFSLPGFLGGTVKFGNVVMGRVSFYIIFITIVTLICIHLLFSKTKIGRAMRCVAQDKDAASLMGINVQRNIMATVALSSAICGIIGVLIIPLFSVDLNMASMIGLKGFASGIIGGFGSMPGAMVGGLLIGLIENLYTGIGPAIYKDVVAFLLMIIFLMIKPKGIMAKKNL